MYILKFKKDLARHLDQCKFFDEISKANKLYHNILYDPKSPPRLGVVYVIEGEEEICKIGISYKDPKFRLKEMSTSTWMDYKIRYFHICPRPECYEKILHRYFAPYRIKREWFNLSHAEIYHYSRAKYGKIDWMRYDEGFDFNSVLKYA